MGKMQAKKSKEERSRRPAVEAAPGSVPGSDLEDWKKGMEKLAAEQRENSADAEGMIIKVVGDALRPVNAGTAAIQNHLGAFPDAPAGPTPVPVLEEPQLPTTYQSGLYRRRYLWGEATWAVDLHRALWDRREEVLDRWFDPVEGDLWKLFATFAYGRALAGGDLGPFDPRAFIGEFFQESFSSKWGGLRIQETPKGSDRVYTLVHTDRRMIDVLNDIRHHGLITEDELRRIFLAGERDKVQPKWVRIPSEASS